MIKLSDYEAVVGKETIEELKALASRLEGKKIQTINSTRFGGGVAEILNRMIPVCQELGVEIRWDVIKGNDDFYNVTKAFHNAIHGRMIDFTPHMKEVFLQTSQENLKEMTLDGDIMFIHDPQPVILVEAREKKPASRWVWRCHIDTSNPQPDVWDFLVKYVERYDAAVFSAPQFARKLKIKEALIAPSIDPLSDKNKDVTQEYVEEVMEKFSLDRKRPVITQISRFDYLKDPVGVIQAYKIVKKDHDCQLVIAGGAATDDPEGNKVLAEVKEEAANDQNILILTQLSDLEVNALQRGSTIIIQKSIQEGFGLTVTEALWKNKPVIAGNVGGIPLQVKDGETGLLVNSVEECASAVSRLLNDKELAKSLGENGHLHVLRNFLLTRQIKDYFTLFLSLKLKA